MKKKQIFHLKNKKSKNITKQATSKKRKKYLFVTGNKQKKCVFLNFLLAQGLLAKSPRNTVGTLCLLTSRALTSTATSLTGTTKISQFKTLMWCGPPRPATLSVTVAVVGSGVLSKANYLPASE